MNAFARRFIMWLLITIIASVSLVFGATLSAQTQLLRSVTGSGGAFMSGSAHTVRGTIGQASVGKSSAEGRSAGIGFWYRGEQGGTDAGSPLSGPTAPELSQNHPNPFGVGSEGRSQSTQITLKLRTAGHVMLAIYDLMGRVRAVLIDERLATGTYTIHIQADRLNPGVYIYRLVQGNESVERKMLLLK
jgi:hypothetical protein